jgi:hypothetical protein
MKSTERLNKFQEKFHLDAIFVVGDGNLKTEDFLKVAPNSMPAAFKFSLLPLAV